MNKVGNALTLVLLSGVALFAGCSDQQTVINKNTVSTEAALQSYTMLGLQYLQGGDTVSAKAAVQKALEIDSKYPQAYNALGLIFQFEAEDVLAERYFQKAISIDPSSSMFHNNYGAFLFAQKRYEQACKELAAATEDPFYSNRAQAFENLGRCYLQINQADLARHAFERSLKSGGSRPLPLVALAQLYFESGQLPEAERYFKQFTDMVSNKRVEHSAQSLWVGIQLARARGNVSMAATYALLLKNLYPDSEEYRQYKESAR